MPAMALDGFLSAYLGELGWFVRGSSWHHRLGVARAPRVASHHLSFGMRGLDGYMRGTGRLLRAGSKNCGAQAGTKPQTTHSAAFWTALPTPSNTPPNWRWSINAVQPTR
jgi:hypothetical protein